MDELEVLKMKYQTLKKNCEMLLIVDREKEFIIHHILSNVAKDYKKDEYYYSSLVYNDENPIFKALGIKPNQKHVDHFIQRKKEFHNDN